ncbi:sulfur carrier protein ThiS [Natronincola ferrireducens]|uniref:Thiamine biosynthesis protein ThiS n=1 Tax=Natronincola ferrireducens TaxID=393762 RepID=A0A1G8ZHF2_9FIRM|nr:sulfur carrier protein ThiS [Natronincola ferrireducens]SDK14024.1 thiamine biosynthesis protein ThiS [Natronincola ferrireducens]
MKIFVNNQEKTVVEGCTVKNLLKSMELTSSVAIWINDLQLLQGDYPTYILKEGDKVKIFKPMGGG